MTIKIKEDEIINIKELLDDYLTIQEDDDDEKLKLKTIITNLDRVEMIILLLYAHYGSERKVAKYLNVSRSPVRTILNKTRNKIKDLLCA